MIKIIEVTNPFEPQRHTVTYVKPTNCTVCKYVKDFEYKQIFLNGVPIEKPTHCFPQDGNEIVVCPKIGGHSFKKWFGVVAMIGLALVSANVAASIAKMAFAGSHLVAGLAAGLVMTIGGKIINSVFHLNTTPKFNHDDRESTPTYSWSLPSIQTQEGGTIGETYGECIPAPQLLMEHVETVGNDQYLNLLLCGGWGPIDNIYEIRIGSTAISNFQNVQIETRLGDNDQTPISFFNEVVADQSVGIEMKENSPVVRTTDSTDSVGIEVTVEFPSGLYAINDKGDTVNNTASFRLEYRKKGDTTWHGAGAGCTTDDSSNITNMRALGDNADETWTLTPRYERGYRTVKRYGKTHKVYSDEAVFVGWDVIGSIHGYTGRAQKNSDYANNYVSFHMGIGYTVRGAWHIRSDYKTMHVYTHNGKHSITASSTSAIRRTFQVKGLEAGQYEVRMTALSLPSSSRKVAMMQWSILSAFDANNNYARPGKVLVGLRIKASNQLSGSLPDVNWRQVREDVWVWNPETSAYEAKSARNPVWAAYDILHGCKRIKNINTGKDEFVVSGSPKGNFVDYWNEWKDAAAYADEKVSAIGTSDTEPRFRLNAFFDTAMTRWDAANKAAAVAHGAIIRHGTQYGIILDRPSDVVQIFGEGQTTEGTFTGKFSSEDERARSIEITYNDTQNDFKNTKFFVRSPTYAENLTKQDNTAKVTLFGCASRSQAYREALYRLACNERQLQTVEFSADVNAVVCEYGDVIGINHSVPQTGIASGRVVSVSGNTVKLDKSVTMEAGKQYSIMFSLSANDNLVTREIVSVDETTTTDTITVSSAFNDDQTPAALDPYAFGIVDRVVKPYRITKITRDGDLKLKITAVEYDEAIYSTDFDKFPYIDYTDPTSLQPPENLQLVENNYSTSSGQKIRKIKCTWDIPDSKTIYQYFRVSYSTDGGLTWTTLPSVSGTQTEITDVTAGLTYRVRVCGIVDGITSGYAVNSIIPTGIDALPPDVQALNVEHFSSGLRRYWWQFDYPTPNDIAGFRLKYTQGREVAWNTGILVQEGLVTGQPYETQTVRQGVHAVMIKAVDNAGNESANVAYCMLNLGDLLQQNVLLDTNFKDNSWAGAASTGFLKSDGYIHAPNTESRWSKPADSAWSTLSDNRWKATWSRYIVRGDITAAASGQFWIKSEIEGPAIVYYRKCLESEAWPTELDAPYIDDASNAVWDDTTDLWKQYSDRVEVKKGDWIQIKVEALNNFAQETIVKELEAYIDVPDRNEHFEDIAISKDGTELPIKTPHYHTTAVRIDAIQDSKAVAIKYLSKNPCVVQLADADGNPVDGVCDISWQGFIDDTKE